MAFRGADCVKFLNLRNGLVLCGKRLFNRRKYASKPAASCASGAFGVFRYTLAAPRAR